MRRWLSLLGTLMLVVMLWTGSTAHAAEMFVCVETTAASADHSSGKRDQSPADSGKAATHHHGGCHSHHVAVPGDEASTVSSDTIADPVGLAPDFRVAGDEPGTTLRPPIA